eukprot:jgi/Astpho2/5190/Aster-x1281
MSAQGNTHRGTCQAGLDLVVQLEKGLAQSLGHDVRGPPLRLGAAFVARHPLRRRHACPALQAKSGRPVTLRKQYQLAGSQQGQVTLRGSAVRRSFLKGMSNAFQLSEFISTSNPDLAATLAQIEHFPASLHHCLIAGPPRSGKTSILLHFAHQLAARGSNVTLIGRREALEHSQACMPAAVPMDSPGWEHVHISPSNRQWHNAEFTRTLAMLHEAVNSINRQLRVWPDVERMEDSSQHYQLHYMVLTHAALILETIVPPNPVT